MGRRTLRGSAESVAAALRPYRDMGVTQLQLRFRSRSLDELLDQMALFAAEAAPRLGAP